MQSRTGLLIALKMAGKAPESYRVGLTHDPAERRRQHDVEHGATPAWQQWPISTLAEAQEMERLHLGRGCHGGTGGQLDPWRPVWFYCFETPEGSPLLRYILKKRLQERAAR